MSWSDGKRCNCSILYIYTTEMLILIALRHLATLQYEIWDVYNMWYIYLRHRTHAIRECIMFTFMCYRSILMKYVIVMWAKHISFFCQQNAVGKKQESRKDKCHIQMLLFRSSMMKDGNKSVLIQKNMFTTKSKNQITDV